MNAEALVFEIDDVLFGIPSMDVVQVLRAVAIDQIPNRPPSIEGLINVRGKVVPVLNLRHLARLPEKAIEITDHLVVMRLCDCDVAIRADRAVDFIRLDEGQLHDVAASDQRGDQLANTSLGIVHLIDWRSLLSEEDTQRLGALQGIAQ